MKTPTPVHRDTNYRFPAEIISHGVWLYYQFCLSYRDVEELLFVRGVIVSYEAMRKWCRKFGQQYANQWRRWRPKLSDKWHKVGGGLQSTRLSFSILRLPSTEHARHYWMASNKLRLSAPVSLSCALSTASRTTPVR